jgi:hypothetical protein
MTNEIEWKRRHIYDPHNPKAGITILYRDAGMSTEYKYALCSPKDTYSRKNGVTTALTKPSYHSSVYFDRSANINEMLRSILQYDKGVKKEHKLLVLKHIQYEEIKFHLRLLKELEEEILG